MLSLSNVRAGYDGREVLHDIGFELPKGRSLSILGPNGCGKTTLLRAIAALIPSEGEITLDGRSVRGMKRRLIAEKIAFMSQISSVQFPYTVHETVMLGRYRHLKGGFFRSPGRRDREVVEECLAATDTLDIRNQRIDQLSGGQLQRVFLAHALAQEPQLILLDEPTNHLDVKHQLELVDWLHEWSRQDGHAVIGVFHDVNLALRLTDQVLFLKDGRNVGCGKADDIIDDTFLRDVYGIDLMGYMIESFGQWSRFCGRDARRERKSPA